MRDKVIDMIEIENYLVGQLSTNISDIILERLLQIEKSEKKIKKIKKIRILIYNKRVENIKHLIDLKS